MSGCGYDAYVGVHGSVIWWVGLGLGCDHRAVRWVGFGASQVNTHTIQQPTTSKFLSLSIVFMMGIELKTRMFWF